jgi:hypothetical protein
VRTRAALTALLLACALVGGAGASVVVRASVEDLAEACDVAVEGVVSQTSVRLDEASGAIWTVHRVRVDRAVAGAATDDVTVRVRGGRVGTIDQETLGAARLASGERVVLFLGPDVGGTREILGLAQGAFRVETDPSSGASVCRNGFEGLSAVDALGRPASAEPLRLEIGEGVARAARGRARRDARRLAARERLDRKLAQWRRRALRHEPLLRGRPGGIER